jgi:hypothetical protein
VSNRPDNKHRRHQRPEVASLLVSRRDAALMLGGCSVATVMRLEWDGRLHARRLRRNGPIYYDIEEVRALAREGASDAA